MSRNEVVFETGNQCGFSVKISPHDSTLIAAVTGCNFGMKGIPGNSVNRGRGLHHLCTCQHAAELAVGRKKISKQKPTKPSIA